MPPPQIAIAEVMQAFAHDAEHLANKELAVTLDYSEASLRHVDHMLLSRLANGLIVPDKLTKEEGYALWEFSKTIGGYLGEVIIRNIGGHWFTTVESTGSTSIQLSVANTVNARPPDSIWRCLTDPDRGSVVALYETLLATLSMAREEFEVVDGIKNVKLRSLSAKAPGKGAAHTAVPAVRHSPWWRFW